MTRQSITGLNSLRFLCFLAIFINHATPYFPYGFLAVDFFFTLSGFLLTLLALNEIKTSGTINKKNFFLRRILRIWPLYFLILIFSFFLLPAIVHRFGWSITLPEKKIYYWLLISNYYYDTHHFALKQLWSIAVEEQFYIIFLFSSFFLKKHTWKIIIVFAAVYPMLLIYRQSHDISLYSNTLYHLISFGAGMAISKIVTGKSYPPVLLTATGILIFLFITILFITSPQLKFFLKIPFCIFAGLVILLIYQTQTSLEKGKGILSITEQLGKYTYGLYVYSGFVISAGIQLIGWENRLLLFLTELACTIIIAAISYHFFESPFLRLKEKFRK